MISALVSFDNLICVDLMAKVSKFAWCEAFIVEQSSLEQRVIDQKHRLVHLTQEIRSHEQQFPLVLAQIFLRKGLQVAL